jgi:MFS family permease
MRDPGRGASEAKRATSSNPETNTAAVAERKQSSLSIYLAILKTPSFFFNTAGQAAVTFAIGAYAVWGATFYVRVRGLAEDTAGTRIGILTAVAGLLGIALGTVLADVLGKITKRAYMIWPFIAVGVAAPFGTLALLEKNASWSLGYLFLASVMMASVLGPSNTVTANVVPARRRAAGYALCIFLVHLFGDISSPWLIGVISELFGTEGIINSPIGRFFASIGAAPNLDGKIMTNLTVGMLAVVPMLILGCFFFLIGSKYLPKDQEKLHEAGGDDEEAGVPAFHH